MFMINPVFIMSNNFRFPLLKTMAFGGVPIGSIDAQLAASTIGIPSKIGFTCNASAMPATTGAKTMTWATLLITSLKKIEISAIKKISNNNCHKK